MPVLYRPCWPAVVLAGTIARPASRVILAIRYVNISRELSGTGKMILDCWPRPLLFGWSRLLYRSRPAIRINPDLMLPPAVRRRARQSINRTVATALADPAFQYLLFLAYLQHRISHLRHTPAWQVLCQDWKSPDPAFLERIRATWRDASREGHLLVLLTGNREHTWYQASTWIRRALLHDDPLDLITAVAFEHGVFNGLAELPAVLPEGGNDPCL